MKKNIRIETSTENNSTENNSAANSVSIGACKHVSDRVRANNSALKQFYKDCKMVDNLPIDEDLKSKIVYQLVATIKDCFVSLSESI
jgi:hypothetical protein